jgi:hypothetical protein
MLASERAARDATVAEGVAGGSNATASAPTRIVTLNAFRNGLPK